MDILRRKTDRKTKADMFMYISLWSVGTLSVALKNAAGKVKTIRIFPYQSLVTTLCDTLGRRLIRFQE